MKQNWVVMALSSLIELKFLNREMNEIMKH